MIMEVGNIVRFKSGGPRMTVTLKCTAASVEDRVQCGWYDNYGIFHESVFPEKTLKKVKCMNQFFRKRH